MTQNSNKELNNKDLKKVFLLNFSNEGAWDHARGNNLGFAIALIPALKKIYANEPEKYKDALFRHTNEFFNTAMQPIPFIQGMILIITVLSKQEQWMIIKNLLLPLRKSRFIRQEQQQNTEISYLHCLLVSIPRKMGVWYWLQRKITERNKTENYHRSGDDDHAGA